ncbi:precursor of CEP14-like [Malus sylvestris]|uniref:precursor of CEP14-like n=1 Tax=Malus sylvestris TaxID=3752 RepID=UPI0010AA5990|nr:precursor of CEP14 [Malus domestica]XP_050145388.1 precursor of CEP14-like [Malus sylvestris]
MKPIPHQHFFNLHKTHNPKSLNSPSLSPSLPPALSTFLATMPRLTALALIFLVAMASSVSTLESRKLLDVKDDAENQKKVASLFLSALPKGKVPASTPSKKGHAVVVNEKLIARHLSVVQNRILAQSVPSPGVGH